ncbi:MAG: hypothetical protein ACK44Z_15230, partial [Pirellulaceae bacterium]
PSPDGGNWLWLRMLRSTAWPRWLPAFAHDLFVATVARRWKLALVAHAAIHRLAAVATVVSA